MKSGNGTVGKVARLALSVLSMMVGVALLLKPIASQAILADQLKARAFEFDETPLVVEGNDRIVKQAQGMNELLALREVPAFGDDNAPTGYQEWMDAGPNAPIATVAIPCLDIALPVFRGTSDAVLAQGTGHLPGSSLPVGGASTRCVIVGHTDYGDMEIFDSIRNLKEGDVVWLTSAAGKLCYAVTGSRIIEPTDTDALGIEEGKDILTLLTCYPPSVNTRRLIVNCERATLAAAPDTTPDTASPSSQQEAPQGASDKSSFGLAELHSAWIVMPLCALITVSSGALVACVMLCISQRTPHANPDESSDEADDQPKLHIESLPTCYDFAPRQIRPHPYTNASADGNTKKKTGRGTVNATAQRKAHGIESFRDWLIL
jgi:sortase A